MTIHLQNELTKLKREILLLGGMVEVSVRDVMDSLENLDTEIAKKIIDGDRLIDEKEVEIEEECLKIIALHQPVAVDLRFLTAVIKINSDLERVADEAVNIAERVIAISKESFDRLPISFANMGKKAREMLKMSLDALVNLDSDLAYKVCLLDDDVDVINNSNYLQVKKAVEQNPSRAGVFLDLLLVSRHLERIADHATNVAEEVIYLIEGEIPRHNRTILGVPNNSLGRLCF